MSSINQTYSQSGEDVIVDFIFNTLQIKTRRYLDVGAHDPVALNNTYYFYKKGHHGVCIEPDPDLAKAFAGKRPKDMVLQIGVSNEETTQPFYLMEPSTLNTFSKKEASIYQKYYPWTKMSKVIRVKLVNINSIIKKYFKDGLDFVSIDTEGYDEKIIKSVNFKKYRPLVICVESAVYSGDKSLTKNSSLINFMHKQNYFTYADTFVNTILVDYVAWQKHGGPLLKGF